MIHWGGNKLTHILYLSYIKIDSAKKWNLKWKWTGSAKMDTVPFAQQSSNLTGSWGTQSLFFPAQPALSWITQNISQSKMVVPKLSAAILDNIRLRTIQSDLGELVGVAVRDIQRSHWECCSDTTGYHNARCWNLCFYPLQVFTTHSCNAFLTYIISLLKFGARNLWHKCLSRMAILGNLWTIWRMGFYVKEHSSKSTPGPIL